MRNDQTDRVRLAKETGLHPHLGPNNDILEGTHYTVVTYCDWADYFVPTTIKWVHNDEVDSLTNPETTRENKQKAIAHVRSNPS